MNHDKFYFINIKAAGRFQIISQQYIARLHGSYECLKYGSVLDGLADLTGGVAESIVLRGDATGSGRLLLELLNMTSVVTANVQVKTAEY